MLKLQTYWLALVFILLFTPVKGQNIFYQEINTIKGAPNNCIYDLAKDSSELLYLGTEQGLYTFTGLKFEHIPINEVKSSSITSINFTKEGTLWCRNFSDQLFYRGKDKVFHPFKELDKALHNDILIDIKTQGNFVMQ